VKTSCKNRQLLPNSTVHVKIMPHKYEHNVETTTVTQKFMKCTQKMNVIHCKGHDQTYRLNYPTYLHVF